MGFLFFCKPWSKLDLPTLRQGSREINIYTYMHVYICVCIYDVYSHASRKKDKSFKGSILSNQN